MSEGIDFSSANLDDFKLASERGSVGQQEVAQEANPAPETNEQVKEVPKEGPKSESTPPPKPDPYKFKDDYIRGVVEFYEKTGDIRPYLEATSIDFGQMSDEEILRRDLREQYKDLSDAALQRLYNQQVVEKYKLDPDEYSDEDVALGKELLAIEAKGKREKFIEWQQSFKAPEQANREDEESAIADAWNKYVQENDATKSILSDKRIVVKNGDSAFNFEVSDPDQLVEMSIDNNKFFQLFVKEDGNVDLRKFYEVAAIAKNKEQYDRSLINWARSIGAQEVTKEIKNPSPLAGSGDLPTETGGDFMEGLLNAFANRGVKK